MQTTKESGFLLGVLNSTPDPIFVLDKNGDIIFANLSFYCLTGSNTPGNGSLHADQIFPSGVVSLLREKTKPLNDREIFITAPDGIEIPFLVSVNEARIENRNYYLYTLKDLSEFKRAEESVFESEELYKTLVNQLPNPILIHVRGRVVFANDLILEITGFSKDEIIGKNVADLLTDPADPQNRDLFRNLSDGVFIEESEFEIRTENRKIVMKNFLLRNSKIKYKGNDATMTILIDITERKHLEKYVLSRVIETEEKDRKQFAADLHDDLGPTLSSIKLHLGLLEHARSPEKFSENLAICNQQLGEAISKMRIVANNLMPRLLENFGLEAAVGSFINTMQHAGSFSITLTSKMKGRRFPTQTELHFYRIICELINNTVKHAGATNAIVKLNYVKGALTLEYTDNGKGYDVSEISKKVSGMGLGNILQRVNLIDAQIQFARRSGKTVVRIRKDL
ncbi:MAG: PAS domain S-box protein [Bacteroidota bacterium]